MATTITTPIERYYILSIRCRTVSEAKCVQGVLPLRDIIEN